MTASAAVAHAELGAIRKVSGGPTLRDALLDLLGKEKLTGSALGYALRRVRGRMVGGFRFTSEGNQRPAAWKVVGPED